MFKWIFRLIAFLFRFIKKTVFLIGLLVVIVVCIFVFNETKDIKIKNDSTLVVDISKIFPEGAVNPIAALFKEESISFFQLLRALESAIYDKKISSVAIISHDHHFGIGQIQELRDLILKIRAKKKVHFFTSSFGHLTGGNTLYYLASACDTINLQAEGPVALCGIGTEITFFKKAFDKWGIGAQFFGKEEYKSAIEPYTRENMSKESREMLSRIFFSFEDQIAGGIAAGRKIKKEEAIQLMHNGPYTCIWAFKNKLVDRVCSRHEFEDIYYGTDKVKLSAYNGLVEFREMRNHLRNISNKRHGYVAVLSLQGEIVQGEAHGFEEGIHSIIAASKIAKIAKDENVKVLVLRLDTPGGEVTGSESIRAALAHVRKSGKKIVISMGNVAASGGYWISTESDLIVANPATITGSIGVYFGKLEFSGIASAIPLSFDSCATADNAFASSGVRPFSEKDVKTLQEFVESTYDMFLEMVSEKRNMTKEEARAVARGRVWIGADALHKRLVDRLGGLRIAIAEAKRIAGLPESAHVKDFSQPPGIISAIFNDSFVRAFIKSAVISALKQEDGKIKSMINVGPAIR